METWDKEYELVLSLVSKCGDIVKKASTKRKIVDTKSCDVDLVTETDKEVEQILISGLNAAFPTHRFIGEETATSLDCYHLTSEATWIIDPVDGTMNFVHGFPHSAISIALFVEKAPVIAVIYNPFMEQLFTARKGQGAFLNGKPIHVSSETKLSKALVMAESGTSRDPEKMKAVLDNLCHLTPIIHGLRTLGSAALNMAMVAMGGADLNFEFGIHAWDIAAGQLLVEEAGGVCIDPAGGPFDVMSRRVLCASTTELAEEIVTHLIQYYPRRDDAIA